jgi:hypothetical protein
MRRKPERRPAIALAMARVVAAPVLVLLAAPAVSRSPDTARSADAAVLVELFTSEGCSSCPPADALLSRLAADRAPGVRVVALSEHVDYWDQLGWRDPFSSWVFTRRQEAYARRLRLAAIYTPQLVVAGRFDVVGGDERAARAAIAAAAREASGRIEARIAPGGADELAVAVEATWPAGVDADVILAVVQDRATSRVTRGENAGRTLEHVAVVRSLAVVGSGAGAFSGRVTLRREELRGDAHAVAFVQERGGGPVQAVTTVEERDTSGRTSADQ